MHRIIRAALTLTLWLATAVSAGAQGLAIAAASDLQAVIPTLVERFHHETGIDVRVTFGSSGNFFSQLQNGAPFDVFLSADLDYPQQLAAAGLAIPDTLFEYASGRLVLWTRNNSQVDLQKGLSALLDPKVRRIAIANPAHAPYGRAAVSALQHQGLYGSVQTKLVLGENISQAAQFVQSGNADAGLLALSVALAPTLKSAGRYVDIPATSYPAVRQGAVVLKRTTNEGLARRFVAFLKQTETQKLLAEFGFGPGRS